jgi:hypothetical protein
MIDTSAQVREVTESVMNELVMNEARLLESPVHEVKSPIRSLSVSTLLTAPPFIPSSTSTVQSTDHHQITS